MRKILLTTLALAALSGTAMARDGRDYRDDSHGYRYDSADYRSSVVERQQRQQARIREGLRMGTITPGEARKLEAEQRSIERAIVRAERDRQVTRSERTRIQGLQNAASRHIAQQAHDRQVSY